MNTLRALVLSSVAASLALPAAAQLEVKLDAVNDAGIVLTRANNSKVIKAHAANSTVANWTTLSILDSSPYAYLAGVAYPPYRHQSWVVSNRVAVSFSLRSLKKGGYKSLHTTGSKGGNPGAQKFRVTLKSGPAIKITMNWTVQGTIYDNGTVSTKFAIGSTTKSLANSTVGTKRDSGSFPVAVHGTTTMDIEIQGTVSPGANNASTSTYEGAAAALTFTFSYQPNSSFTNFGKSCGGLVMGSKGQLKRGNTFRVTLDKAPAKARSALLLAFNKDSWKNNKLPLNLSFMGASNCWLNVDWVYPMYHLADSTGHSEQVIYLSPYAAYGTYYVQWLVFDSNAPGGLTLSQGAQIKY